VFISAQNNLVPTIGDQCGQRNGYQRETSTVICSYFENRENNLDDFRNYLRMNDTTFDHLLNMVKPYVTKQNTVMRASVSPEERLIAALRFLATGRSYEDLKFSSGISAQALGCIIPEMYKVIYERLKGR
jgi:hypothetical protein